MAQTSVDVVVSVKNLTALDRLKKSLAGVDGATLKGERSIKRFEGSIAKLGRTLAGLAIGDQLRRAFGSAAQLSGTEQRINSVTKKYTQFIGIQKSAEQAAKAFAVSQQQALSDFSDLASRLGSSGTSLKELENIYGGFNTLLLQNAVGAQQAASAQLQLNQALGSGRLAGEEFNAINEATPQLLDEVAKILQVSRGELKKLASDGKISSQVLIQALTNIKTQGADVLADSLETPAGKLRQFEAAVKDFQVAVGKELLPAITPLIQELTKLLKVFSELPEPVKTALVALAGLAATAAVLGPLFGVIGGTAKALGASLLSLGAGGSAAAGSLSLLTKALVILKGAMIALPWVALAAGLAALGKMTYDYYKKKEQLNRLTKGTGVTMNEFKTAIAGAKDEVQKAEGKLKQMESAGISNARAINAQRKRVNELKGALEAIQGTYEARVKVMIDIEQNSQNIAGIDYRPDGPGGRLVPINPPKTVSQIREEQEARLKKKLPSPFSGGSSSGSGGAARESQIPQLTRELDLSNKLLENDRQRLEAQFNNNTALVNRLAQDRIETELSGKKAEIAAEEIPTAEKKLKLALAENDATRQLLELKNQVAEAERNRKKAVEGITKPLTDEIELLQARLNGNYKDIKQLQEIRDLKKQILEADPNADTSKIDGMVKERDALLERLKQVEALRQQYKSLASGIAGEMTSAFRSIIDGSKSAEEAMADMFEGIANKFLDMAMKILTDALTQQLMNLFTGLAGGIGGGGSVFGAQGAGIQSSFGNFLQGATFADGGRPMVGDVSLVGENGPELVKFDQPARVYSNEQSQAAMSTYNPANESMVAVTPASTFKMETTVINGVEYATIDQVREMGVNATNAGAKAGEQRAMNRLRQSRSTRNRLGM